MIIVTCFSVSYLFGVTPDTKKEPGLNDYQLKPVSLDLAQPNRLSFFVTLLKPHLPQNEAQEVPAGTLLSETIGI